ncbi:MAG: ATP-binding cassette domain-containing protein [Planctomycetes bacterium]|nr:ATP-binding cassette domain-containing protein [Planctomycetota bacterium]
MSPSAHLLVARELTKSYAGVARGSFGAPRSGAARVDALVDVSFELAHGERLAVVGESGSGKSTLVKALLALAPLDRGRVELAPRAGPRLDWLALSKRERSHARRWIQPVFQAPMESLNPRRPVLASLAEPLFVHGLARGSEAETRALALAQRVGLEPETTARFPHELSLGQAQRACLARALAPGPELLLLDEPTSALDVGLQAQIVDLLAELARERSLAILFVSHDLDLVRYFADRVLVLERGRLVEAGPVERVLGAPEHPHTRALVRAWGAA